MIRAKIPNIWRKGSNICPPWLQQAVYKLLQEHMHSCLPRCVGWGWGCGCYCAKCWNWPKLTAIGQVFPWKLHALNRLQSSKRVSSDRFCQWNCCLGEDRDSWCFPLHHLPRISMVQNFFLRKGTTKDPFVKDISDTRPFSIPFTLKSPIKIRFPTKSQIHGITEISAYDHIKHSHIPFTITSRPC